jgi:hypothetical protein
MFLRLYSSQTALSSTPSNVSSSTYLRVFVTGTTARLITLKDSGGNTLGTTTILPYESFYLKKNSTDTLEVAGGITDVFAS